MMSVATIETTTTMTKMRMRIHVRNRAEHPGETTIKKNEPRKWNKQLEDSWRKFTDDEVGEI